MKTKNRKKSKPQPPEFTRPTKERLLELIEDYSGRAMQCDLYRLSLPDEADYWAHAAELNYTVAEALELWADQIAAEELESQFWTLFDADVEKEVERMMNHKSR